MRLLLTAALVVASVLPAGCRTASPSLDKRGSTTIAFGACCHQDKEQPIWDAIVAAAPDLFLFAGDNIYGDSEDMAVLEAKYALLGAVPGYQRLLDTCPILAVYDDHDFGINDGGREYPMRAESAALCLDFFGVPADDPRRQHEGVYGATVMGEPGQRVQVILLDTRYFRDPIDADPRTQSEKSAANVVGWYRPTLDKTRTLLGEAQWAWLEEELRKDADVRLIISSVQVVPNEKGMECWGNLPHERTALFDLIGSTGAEGVVFLSGDVHFAEVSRTDEGPYPLHDFTSSGLTQSPDPTWHQSVNSYRRPGMVYADQSFGVVRIDWAGDSTQLRLQARTIEGAVAFEEIVPLKTLR